MKLKLSTFKAYDIRGVYPAEINERVAERLGWALARYFRKGRRAVVGYDARLSSQALETALVAGLSRCGVNVMRLGMVPTPVVSFAVLKRRADFGIMVSASHNPGNYNAFKIIDSNANQIGWQQGLNQVAKLMGRGAKGAKDIKHGNDAVRQVDVGPQYQRALLQKFRKRIKSIRVAVDYGNGVGAMTAGPIFKDLKIKSTELFSRPDGRFPHHDPNPHDPKNFRWLERELKRGHHDLGIFFDGDGDRAVFLDHGGRPVRPDVIAGIFALDILKRHHGAVIYHDLRFSRAVIEAIKSAGGRAVELPVGSPYYKLKIPEQSQAWLGAELSGHAMFREWHGIDDGLFTALKLMAIMSKTKQPLALLALPFQRYAQSGEISMRVRHPDRALLRIARTFRGGRKSRRDGLTIEYPDWWFNARTSRTEPMVRLVVEAGDQRTLQRRVAELSKLIKGS